MFTKEEKRDIAEKAIDKIIFDLTDRKGINHEWNNIDEDIIEEIIIAWQDIIINELNNCEKGV